MLMSMQDESTLEKLESDIIEVADSMLSFPIMIPGTRYYKGIKVICVLVDLGKHELAFRLLHFCVTLSFRREEE